MLGKYILQNGSTASSSDANLSTEGLNKNLSQLNKVELTRYDTKSWRDRKSAGLFSMPGIWKASSVDQD